MRIFITIIALLLAAPVMADIASGLPTFSWTQPATWSDGSVLTTSQITGYQLNCGASQSRRIASATGVPPSVTPTANRFAPGSHSCTLAVFARKTTGDPEVLGLASSPVAFTVPQPIPGAVTGLSVE